MFIIHNLKAQIMIKPTSTYIASLLIFLLFCSFNSRAQTTALPEKAVTRVEAQATELLITKKPYLTDTGSDGSPCSLDTEYPNWKGITLQKCNYVVERDKTGVIKHATVLVHIPTVKQLARWIVAACVKVKGAATKKCTNKLYNAIRSSSGGQFPVNGIVFEDMDGDDFQNTWNFRDGVTVLIENGIDNDSKAQPSSDQIEKSLTGKVLKTGKYGYARLQGTTRENYLASCKIDKNCITTLQEIGTTAQRKVEWLGVVRKLYQSALTSDENALMIAWARANKGSL